MSTCGVHGCPYTRTGTVPASTLLDGDLVFISGEWRLPVCNLHGRDHHRLWQAGWSNSGER